MKHSILLILAFFSLKFNYLSAQNSIAISTSYEITLADLNCMYNNTVGGSISYRFPTEKFTGSFNIGFHSFKPKADTLYYGVGEYDYGTLQLSRYSIIPLYMSFLRNIRFTDRAMLLLGINIGYYYVWYRYELSDKYIEEKGLNIEGKGVVSPVIGLQYKINDRIEIAFESSYNVFFSLGTSEIPGYGQTVSSSYHYNPKAGQIDFTFSNKLSYIYKF